jgi:LysM repeat protein
MWFDSEQIGEIVYTPNTASPGTTYMTAYPNNAFGQPSQAYINDGTPREVNYVNNLNGQILSSITQTTSGGAFNGPASDYYYFNGVQLGEVSNNGTGNVDYTSSIAEQQAVPGSGYFTDGATSGTTSAQFGTTLQGINALGNQTQTGTGYTVQAGDTLQSIAQALWGNSSYWYLLADANGLSPDATLSVGENLNIPQVVGSSQNNASTNTVYNQNQAIGNISPTHAPPPPKQGGCGVIGEIILAVVAVAAAFFIGPEIAEGVADLVGGGTTTIGAGLASTTAVTVAAGSSVIDPIATLGAEVLTGVATSAVTQGVGLATGMQSKFSWAGLGEAAIGAVVGAGLGSRGAFSSLGPIAGGALQALAGGAITQGIGLATGLQSNFDWEGLAEGAVEGGIMGYINSGDSAGKAGGIAPFQLNPGDLINIVPTIGDDVEAAETPSTAQAAPQPGVDGGQVRQTIGNAIAGSQTPQSGWTTEDTTGATVNDSPVEVSDLPPISAAEITQQQAYWDAINSEESTPYGEPSSDFAAATSQSDVAPKFHPVAT